jgi:hypothetical protein
MIGEARGQASQKVGLDSLLPRARPLNFENALILGLYPIQKI